VETQKKKKKKINHVVHFQDTQKITHILLQNPKKDPNSQPCALFFPSLPLPLIRILFIRPDLKFFFTHPFFFSVCA
jgi:hypothetical protein